VDFDSFHNIDSGYPKFCVTMLLTKLKGARLSKLWQTAVYHRWTFGRPPIAAGEEISSIEHDLPEATYSTKYLLASPKVLLYIQSQLAKRTSIHFPFVGVVL